MGRVDGRGLRGLVGDVYETIWVGCEFGLDITGIDSCEYRVICVAMGEMIGGDMVGGSVNELSSKIVSNSE